MRRTVKRTVTITTTTHYTIGWEADPAAPDATREPALIVLPESAPVSPDPSTKEIAKPIAENELITSAPTSHPSQSNFPTGESS